MNFKISSFLFTVAIFLAPTAQAECYTYDALNRLEKLAYKDGAAMEYSLDKHGNREQVDTNISAGEACAQPATPVSNTQTAPVLSASIVDLDVPNRAPVVNDKTVYASVDDYIVNSSNATSPLTVYDLDADVLSVASFTANNPSIVTAGWVEVNTTGTQTTSRFQVKAISLGTGTVTFVYQDEHGLQTSGMLTVIVGQGSTSTGDGGSSGSGGGDGFQRTTVAYSVLVVRVTSPENLRSNSICVMLYL